MPPRTRRRTAKAAQTKRQPTQFGELDVTPTSRHLQSPQAQDRDAPTGSSNLNAPTTQLRPNPQAEEFEDGLDDTDLIQLDCSPQVKTHPTQGKDFAWSETESLMKRSSPLRVGETARDVWEFDEKDSLDPFSSPGSGVNKLPDTVPLPSNSLPGTQLQSQSVLETRVDFSETASTMRRSSPITLKSAIDDLWQFNETSPQEASQDNLTDRKKAETEHLPIDELYDATPAGSPRSRLPKPGSHLAEHEKNKQRQAHHVQDPTPPRTQQLERLAKAEAPKTQKKSMKELLKAELESDDDDSAPRPGKGQDTSLKKRKQRAKTPIQFDKSTNQIREIPQKIGIRLPPKLPLVNTMKNVAQASSSPVTSAKKRPVPKVSTTKEPQIKKQKAPPKSKGKVSHPLAEIESITATAGMSERKPAEPLAQEPKAKNQGKRPVDQEDDASSPNAIQIATAPILISSDDDSDDLSDIGDSLPLPPQAPSPPLINAVASPVKGVHGLSPKPSTTNRPPSNQKSNLKPKSDNSPMVQTLDSVQKSGEGAQRASMAPSTESLKRVTRSMMRNGQNDTGKPGILTPRDPNKVMKRSSRQKNTSKTGELERPEASSYHAARKSSKVSRSFSISEVGSPVPVEPVQATHANNPGTRDKAGD